MVVLVMVLVLVIMLVCDAFAVSKYFGSAASFLRRRCLGARLRGQADEDALTAQAKSFEQQRAEQKREHESLLQQQKQEQADELADLCVVCVCVCVCVCVHAR